MKKLLVGLVMALVGLTSWTSASPASALDVYTTPGYHTVNGRQWQTECSAYSTTVTRCFTNIWATQVKMVSGRYVQTNGWVFNNLTYLPSPRAQWSNNPLGNSGEFIKNGREWRTECDTTTSGRNGCRSYIWSTFIAATKTSTGATKFVTRSDWVFNNIVRFSTDYFARYSGTGSTVLTLPVGVVRGTVSVSYAAADEYDSLGVTALDAENVEVDWPLFLEPSTTRGTGAFGLYDDVRRIQVDTEGSWELTVRPLSLARQFSGEITGQGPDVLWYMGGVRTATLTHSGSSNFIVDQYGEEWKILVNKIGPTTAQAALLAGPALVVIDADGGWTIR
ncbi:hypothetical protein BCR15_03590 [Tessaracoccus lapidicaptus]|uniref:Uncharacterized protein n=1 Tax=Tessaracoccus lapidicaptus TaxID=1427523 RepID=A0A1C0ANP7_9ACTN|nr:MULTISPECIES: hypothetical protein [Tessaracoccus]AQX14567.1 hypothetical protein BKM78_00425 [Tessaracoccus sp. T2.5-30]OCL34775.1 hypothetical protein BCR15_03590 [Tessaracoccus lapidicaptus]VEP38593.1 hypothetical protein TLA_TLA_00087 [Tessaracoccus lapidicaptus]